MKLCIALDLPTKEQNLNLVNELKEFNDIWYKIGFRSYIRDGVDGLKDLKNINPDMKIFLDLKLYDIPNTMADTAEELSRIGVDMFNIHASSGSVAMTEIVDRLKSHKKRPLILGVTALTSFNESDFKTIYNDTIENKVSDFAKMCYKNGLDGVVSSALESKMIKKITSDDFITLTPGIRPAGSSLDDQTRVVTPPQAKKNLVDFIVVGRPIYKSNTPKKVVQDILNQL